MNTIENASDYAQEAGERIAGATSQAAKALGEKGEQLLSAEQKMMKQCCNYVSYHPVASVAMAIAAGFLLSHLLRER
ncbi:DUF883 domain-containing protein [Candidatus Methylobacter oryzae]|uniref:DUF883 domain-containing protein n=1 Tax=Candidatus Methylobacter oryzae TaxID=2497749 RepID=A0ABY3C6M6_9GAMM|nr:DUF883 domain-containing protein [Candidatus Methylobacter oryzae]TRW91254.1 DUF883 domain-containing protein [Candidatus Methylobacter oryzae]